MEKVHYEQDVCEPRTYPPYRRLNASHAPRPLFRPWAVSNDCIKIRADIRCYGAYRLERQHQRVPPHDHHHPAWIVHAAALEGHLPVRGFDVTCPSACPTVNDYRARHRVGSRCIRPLTTLYTRRRLACTHPETSTILLQSKGKTPSNSMCSAFNKDVQKGVDVTVDGVRGVCRLGKHFLRCIPAIPRSTCRPIKIHISSLAPISGRPLPFHI